MKFLLMPRIPLFSKESYPQAPQESYRFSPKAGLFTSLRTSDQKQNFIGVPLYRAEPKSFIH
ncbi:MAG: hypothetical protein ACKVKR_09210, partial [Pseudomonadales bacterium]